MATMFRKWRRGFCYGPCWSSARHIFMSGERAFCLSLEMSDRIKMQQYIDQNHLSKWKCYTLALCHTQGNSRFLHHPLLQQRWPHKEATWPGFPYCSNSPSKHPLPECKGRRWVLADKPHRGAWPWTALALTLTSVDVRPRKPLASPAQNPNCSCCRASTSPT